MSSLRLLIAQRSLCPPTLFHTTSRATYVKVTRAQTAEELEALPDFSNEEAEKRLKKKQPKARAQVFTWGYSGTGALGEPRFIKPEDEARILKEARNRRRPVRMRAIPQSMEVHDVAAGFGFTVIAATLANQPWSLFGCGLNTDSQLGYQRARPSRYDATPLMVVANLVPIQLPIDASKKQQTRQNRITKVAAGRAHTLALSSCGTVLSLGNNAFGQCGRPIVENENYFGSHQVHTIRFESDDPVAQIVCGQDHSLFLTEQGKVFACGWGADGQLGNGSYRSSGQVAQVSGDLQAEKIVHISSAADCCLAVSQTGALFGWGNCEYGQLGTGDDKQVKFARHLKQFEACIEGNDKIVNVAAGGSMACLLTDSGRVYTWGYGLLGLGPKVLEKPLPTLIKQTLFGDRPVRKLVAGVNRMAAVNDRGQLFMWGANGKAQLGLAGIEELSFPMPVTVSARVDKVSLGIDHSVAMGRDRI